jgi:hypothetical protein
MDELSQRKAKLQAKIAAIEEQERHIERKKLPDTTKAVAITPKAPTKPDDSDQTVEAHRPRHNRKLSGSDKKLESSTVLVEQNQLDVNGSTSTIVAARASRSARKSQKASKSRFI